MNASATATRKDIDDVLQVLDIMMTRFDERFLKVENSLELTQKQANNIFNQLDSIEKQLGISDNERLVMAFQLTRLHDWVDKAAERIDVKFVH